MDTPIGIVVVWSVQGTALMNNENYTMTQPVLVSDNTYTSSLTFTPLDQPSLSSGVYICNVMVQPHDDSLIRRVYGSGNLTLEVSGELSE